MQWRRSISGLHFVLGGSLGIPLIPGLLPRSPLLARIRCTHSLEAYTHAHTSARALRPSPSPHVSSPIFSPLLSHPRFCLCSLSFSLSLRSLFLTRSAVSFFAPSVCFYVWTSRVRRKGCCALRTRNSRDIDKNTRRSTPTHTPDEPAPS